MDSYNYKDYSIRYKAYQKNMKCHLCKTRHTVRLHAFAPRKYHLDEEQQEETRVLRIFCPINFKQRKATGEKLQYTITVLPSFLQSYSHIPVMHIINSIITYISGKTKYYAEAAIDMLAESDRTFRTYFYRFRDRLSGWIALMEQMIAFLTHQMKWNKAPYEKTTIARWKYFHDRLKYFSHLSGQYHLPGKIVIREQDYIQYGLSLLTLHSKGLGP